MDFDQFKSKVDELVKDALKDETIHLRRSLNGEISVIYGYVSPEYAPPGVIISRHNFSVGQYLAREIDLEEYFRYMMDDINEELKHMMMGE